jgi:HK97 family phage major capsid protein
MGRIAELFEKKANGSITDEEKVELAQLKKEAETLTAEDTSENDDQNQNDDTQNDDEQDVEKEVDRLAQRLADSVTQKFGGFSNRMEKILDKFENGNSDTTVHSASDGYIFDKKLGKKVAVSELANQKVALPERKAAGKKVTEVSMKTVHFLQALIGKNVEKLQLLSEGTAADGGYLVPEEFANMIIEDARDQNIMRQISRPSITIQSDTFHLPSLASRPQAAWRNEKAVKNTSTVNFGENVFTPYSLAVIVGLSNELVADASLGVGSSIVNYVAGLMSTSVAEKEEQAFWVGSGSGQPSGVDGGVYTLRTVPAGLTDSSRADAIIQAFHRTPQGYRNRGVWVGNSGTWENISELKDSQGRYLLTDLANSPTQTLRGRPVYESNYLAGGTLLFGAFGDAYQIVDREGISVRVSDEATVAGSSAFEKNLTYVRVEKRVDAELVLPAAVTKVTGLGTP